jgi:ubiquinol-cytochrome c reductase iron-sulfur subunit
MRKFLNWLLGLLVVARAVRGADTPPPRRRIVEPGEPHPGGELAVAALLVLTAAAAALSIVAYALDWSTQAFGGALAGAIGLLAAALIVAAKTFVISEEIDEPYPPLEHESAQDDVAAILRESATPITRKKLLGGAAGLAGTALGAALVTPALSLGPVFDTSRLEESPWRRGRLLVDKEGLPVLADDIRSGTFYTAFPEGADRKAISSPLVHFRLDPAELRLPAGREDWAPEGIVAYSKICTHAGCAIALYRNPKFTPSQPDRALVCPCHYSTFDPAAGGEVLFGPAGRPLPQLPLEIGPGRRLRAAGDYSGPPGPSWWGVR